MQQEVAEVVARRVHAENLNIQHVRQPRNWMPEFSVGAAESPFDTFQRQALLHCGVAGNIYIIIVIYKVEAQHLRVYNKD